MLRQPKQPLRYPQSAGLIISCGVLGALACCYLYLIYRLTPYGFLDYPNHLARTKIIAELLLSAQTPLHKFYFFEWQFTSYLFCDLLLATFITALGEQLGTTLWTSVVFLAPISAAAWLTRRSLPTAPVRTVFFVILGSSLVASNWMFMMGFFNFQLGIAVCLLGTYSWSQNHRLIAIGALPSLAIRSSACLFVLGLLAYFTHLSSFFFLGLSVAVIATFRLLSSWKFQSLFLSVLPLAAVLVVILLIANLGPLNAEVPRGEVIFTPLREKLSSFVWLHERYDWRIDKMFLVTLCLSFGLGAFWYLFRHRDEPKATLDVAINSREYFIVAAACGLSFLALPAQLGSGVGFIDVRAIPYGAIFLILSFATWLRGKSLNFSLILAFILTGLNLYALLPGIDYAEKVERFAALHENVPPGKRLLPIVCDRNGIGGHPFGLHALSRYADSEYGMNPYLFSRSGKHPQTYFGYHVQPAEMPSQTWCSARDIVDLNTLLPHYDFLVFDSTYESWVPLVEQVNSLKAARLLSPFYFANSGVIFRVEHENQPLPLSNVGE